MGKARASWRLSTTVLEWHRFESLSLIPCLTSGGLGGGHKNVVLLLLGIRLWFKLRQPGGLSEDTVEYCRVVERSGALGPVLFSPRAPGDKQVSQGSILF